MRTSLIIFIISLLFYASIIILNGNSSFIYDEGVYALMTKEFSDNPAMVMPTLTGENVEWKPPLFFWAYSPFYILLNDFGLPVEMVFRFPSAVFGALSVLLVFLITKKLYDEKIAFAAAALFLTSPALLFSSSLVMMEAFSVCLVLAAVYLYINEKPFYGMLFLGMLALTKWLYAVAPILFIALYFLRSKKLPHILLTFLAVPVGLFFYLLLAYFFGSYENVIMILGQDVSHADPGFDFNRYLGFLGYVFYFTYPLSLIYVAFALLGKFDLNKELPLVAMAALAFVIPVAQYFLFWYVVVIVPAMAIFASAKINDLRLGKFFLPALLILMFLNILAFLYFPFVEPEKNTREAAQFMKGKNVTFLERGSPNAYWHAINARYNNTDKTYLLLEQLHPGLLFYRFNDTDDYDNVLLMFTKYGHVPSCSGYLVVYGNTRVPDCFELLWKTSGYRAYKAIS